ncbi:MAG: ATP-dependent helicase [Patescibacteria group bacterium]
MSKILKKLNDQQKKAVQKTEGPMLIAAGPGSGKTRCLTHKIAYLIKEKEIGPEKIMAVTFTNKAADEMKTRITHLCGQESAPSWLGTFHSLCARILRNDGAQGDISKNFVIYDTTDSKKLIKKILDARGISSKKTKPRAVLTTISSAKNELIGPEEYRGYARGYFQQQVASIYPDYQKMLKNNQALDFGDLIFRTVQLFQENSKIRKKWQTHFNYLLVDEYQDTNHAQYTFVKILAEKHRNLHVVGDVSQAIFGWRGADFRNILNFQTDWPDAQIYRLEKNYRSTKTIITAAKNVIENNHTHISLDLWTDNEKGSKIKLYEAQSEKDEAQYLTNKIKKQTLNGPERVAVLYRTNAQSRALEETFIHQGIPYQLVGGVKFYERKEIKDILSYLRIIENPQDTLSLERIINVPPRRVGNVTQQEIRETGWNLKEVDKHFEFNLLKLLEDKDNYTPLEIMDKILEQTKYLEWLEDGSEENEDRIENVKELRSVASKFPNLESFLESVTLIESARRPGGTSNMFIPQTDSMADNVPPVTLMTLHAAKGLEFPVVFIVGLEEGLFPHSRSLTDTTELEEERRLLYVGMTRAQKELYLTYAQKRLYFGKTSHNLPSRFLSEIPENLIDLNRGSYNFSA